MHRLAELRWRCANRRSAIGTLWVATFAAHAAVQQSALGMLRRSGSAMSTPPDTVAANVHHLRDERGSDALGRLYRTAHAVYGPGRLTDLAGQLSLDWRQQTSYRQWICAWPAA